MMAKRKLITLTVLTLTTLFSIIATSLSWFAITIRFNTQVVGSSISNYFGGGDGQSESTAFKIQTPKHLYNLSWLQGLGVFTTQKYFKLENDINLAGQLKGTSDETGAIPPIGTDAKPFIGHFNGNGKTIKNLWVSSEPDDWKEKPLNISTLDIGLSIGFFGNVDQITVGVTKYVGTAKNFYLENLEITSKRNNSRIGFVAGYVNGNMDAIGLKNPRISIGSNAIQVKSDYSLFGVVGPNVKWQNSPDASLGNLVIDPNAPNNLFPTNLNTITPVPNSITDTAFYIPSLRNEPLNGGPSGLQKYNTKVTVNIVNAKQTIIADNAYNASTVTTISNSNKSLVSDDLWARYSGNPTPSKTVYFDPAIKPLLTNQQFNEGQSVNLQLSSSNAPIIVPRNVVWFKPLKGGISGLSFLKQNNSRAESISVYHFRRSGNLIINFGETIFTISKNIGNKTIVYFDFEIPQSMVENGFEFMVGATSDNTAASSSGFFYLSLSGTDLNAGEISGDIRAVDYVYRLGPNLGFENLNVTNYTPKKTLLKFFGSYHGTIMYDMKDQPNYDGKVYFKLKEGNIAIMNPISPSVGGVGTAATTLDTGLFIERAVT